MTRISDAELAAEVHRQSTEVHRLKIGARGNGKSTALDRFMTLVRFATHEHFDEQE